MEVNPAPSMPSYAVMFNLDVCLQWKVMAALGGPEADRQQTKRHCVGTAQPPAPRSCV